MVWKMRKLKAYLRPSLTTFCRNLFERTEENRRRIRASDSLQFSAQYKLTGILRRNIHLTYTRTMSSNNPEKSLQRSESHLFWHEQGKGNKPLAAQAIDEDEEDALVLILNSATPIQLRFKELCGGFYTTLRSPSKRISVKRSVTVFHRSSFYRCKHRIHQLVHIPNIPWQCENCYLVMCELLSTAMRTIDFKAIFVSYVQFWINFHSFKVRLSLDTELIHIL